MESHAAGSTPALGFRFARIHRFEDAFTERRRVYIGARPKTSRRGGVKCNKLRPVHQMRWQSVKL